MNTMRTEYEVPEAKTRLDSVATFTVLAAMLVSMLSGVFVIDSAPMHVSDTPARYAAVEEAQR